jgi:hypothetical protein
MTSVKLTDYYYTLEEIETGEKYLYVFDSKEELMNRVSRQYAFSDCEGEMFLVNKIICDGKEVQYCGWEPEMVYRFEEVESREVIWDRSYPGWDH